jgi:beta-lactamase superfamily II metal-dependent hydrolase
MTYSNHKKRFPNDFLVYIEEFDKKSKTVLFDFYDSNEFAMFSEYSNVNMNMEKPTMILFRNYQGRTIQENTYYSIKKEIIFTLWKLGTVSNVEDSFLISYSVDLSNLPSTEIFFGHSVSVNNDFYASNIMYNRRDVNDIIFELNGHIKVNIRNVGQGNWNEVTKNDTYILVYDCGTDTYAKTSDVRNLINQRNTKYKDDKPVFILSHWDKDHYHCLLGMTDDELMSFSKYIFRNDLPNLTSRKLYSRITSLLNSKDIYGIGADNRVPKVKTTSLRPLNTTSSQIVLYNSQYHKNRNISGLVVSLKTAKSSVIFSGDCQYAQLSQFVLPHLNYSHDHYLIVPHHGGAAGRYIYENLNNMKLKKAIISVGKNSYKHPDKVYLSCLNDNFENVEITLKTNTDILINL